MYSSKYLRSVVPILVNAAFFAALYLLVRSYLAVAWMEYLVGILFLLTIAPFVIVVVEYEVYTRWEETFMKFWKTQHFKKETRRRVMLLGLVPIGKEERVRVERTLQQPPIEVVVRDLIGNAELLIPVLNAASRLLAPKRI